jgi:hypothetical protein
VTEIRRTTEKNSQGALARSKCNISNFLGTQIPDSSFEPVCFCVSECMKRYRGRQYPEVATFADGSNLPKAGSAAEAGSDLEEEIARCSTISIASHYLVKLTQIRESRYILHWFSR